MPRSFAAPFSTSQAPCPTRMKLANSPRTSPRTGASASWITCWTMNDYYSFAAFFAQVAHKPGDDPRETVIFDRSKGEIKHPITGAAMPPQFLGGGVPEIKDQTRREVLARWLTSPANPYFARNL